MMYNNVHTHAHKHIVYTSYTPILDTFYGCVGLAPEELRKRFFERGHHKSSHRLMIPGKNVKININFALGLTTIILFFFSFTYS